MALNNNQIREDLNYSNDGVSGDIEKVRKIRHKLLILKETLANNELNMCEIRGQGSAVYYESQQPRTVFVASKETELVKQRDQRSSTKKFGWTSVTNWCARIGALVLLLAIIFENRDRFESRCAIRNNYLVMEMTRPVTNCDICREAKEVVILENVTRSTFDRYAYAGRPVLVKNAVNDWLALRTFSFDFFKDLYNQTKGAYESVREECQFFPFKTDFISLEEVFNMPRSRAEQMTSDEVTWYVGWSNCNPEIASVLRKHYSRPHFLPDESESSAIDWIFMGYSGQGASKHLDYVQRPSWQAQISGRKKWQLVPPPECEEICQSFEVNVDKGDIILVDTNQWYHDTFIYPGEISITIGSEYD